MSIVLLTMVLLRMTLDTYAPPVMASNQVVHISGSTIIGRKLIFAAGSQNAAPLLLGSLEKGYVPPSAPGRLIPFSPGTMGSEHAIVLGDTSVNSLKAAPNGGPPTSPTLTPASINNQMIKRDMPASNNVPSKHVPPVIAANQVFVISGSTISGRKLIFAAGARNAAPLLLGSLEKGYVPPSAPDKLIPSGPGTIGSEQAIAGDTSVNSLKTAPSRGPPTSPTLAPASTKNQRIKRDMPAGNVMDSTPSIAYP